MSDTQFHPRMLKLLTEEERADYELASTLSVYGHFEADETMLRLLKSLALARWREEVLKTALTNKVLYPYETRFKCLQDAEKLVNARLDAREGE